MKKLTVVSDITFNRTICVAAAFLLSLFCVSAGAQTPEDTTRTLDAVVVKATDGVKSKMRTENTEVIGMGQLVRAACCNLGESFVANPSVDVNYSDAATGAKQIKLLGLSGTYVQMMTENVPNFRGGSLPYALGYVPGPWMQSIQVSKGASSVKNGYESVTGQINIEYMKPQGIDGVRGNVYFDSQLKLEANADASIHLTDKLSTSLLLHFENRQMDHDGNGDGFMDMPKLRQYNIMHRWAYVSQPFISQLSFRALRDERVSGMSRHHAGASDVPHYGVEVNTNRYELQWKNGFNFDYDHNTSIALMLQGTWHDANNHFGRTTYDLLQKTGYAQLMFETDFTEHHNLAAGLSTNIDYYDENYDIHMDGVPFPARRTVTEVTSGAYAQYTYKLGDKLTAMAGMRIDTRGFNNKPFVTPRLHVKYTPIDVLTLRASAGKGYRRAHALAENSPMLASGRTILFGGSRTGSFVFDEEAWNYGVSAGMNVPLGEKNLEVNAEYYYTTFGKQLVLNYDGKAGAHTLNFEALDGKSYSHTFQVDATYPFFEGFTATAAFRYNDARTTYDGVLRLRPLTSRYKGLLTMSYKTPMEIWQFDVTGQLNGHGELYDHSRYPTYFQLQAQVTREFRKFSIYLGGENLTNYRIPTPIINAHNPWSRAFDATQIWGPTDGAMAYVGIRFKFEKL